MDLSVAICTYKRAELLPTTLASLADAERPRLEWELIIVDNACDKAVERVAESFRDRLPIRYVAEPQVGIARARNRAVESAAAPVVLFADDDVLFDPHWLVRMAEAIRAHPECQFWGGRIEPTWEEPPPPWFDMAVSPTMGDAVVRYDIGAQPRYWDPAKDPPYYTCNLALSVPAVRAAGMFDVTLGHVGHKRGTGEDSWMILSISGAGGRGWYAADALLRHPVPPQRTTRPFLRRFAWRQGGVGVDMLRRQQKGRTPRWLYRVAFEQTFAGLWQWIRGALGRDQARAFAGQFAVIFNLSKLWHAVRGVRD